MLNRMQVQYFPQLGYLISLPISDLRRWGRANGGTETDAMDETDDTTDASTEGTLPEIDGLRFAFTSNLDVFYKCMPYSPKRFCQISIELLTTLPLSSRDGRDGRARKRLLLDPCT